MNDRHRSVVLAAILLGVLSFAGCGKSEEKVHESWETPPTKGEVDDSTLNSTVKSALQADPVVKNLEIRVETNKGEVMLSGLANSQAQADRVNMLAWMVDGVKKVDNKISVGSGAAPADN